jgi:hypothetical protein
MYIFYSLPNMKTQSNLQEAYFLEELMIHTHAAWQRATGEEKEVISRYRELWHARMQELGHGDLIHPLTSRPLAKTMWTREPQDDILAHSGLYEERRRVERNATRAQRRRIRSERGVAA